MSVLLQDRAGWRVRVVGLSMGGESPEDMAPTISNLLAYDGAQRTFPKHATLPACQLVTRGMVWHQLSNSTYALPQSGGIPIEWQDVCGTTYWVDGQQ